MTWAFRLLRADAIGASAGRRLWLLRSRAASGAFSTSRCFLTCAGPLAFPVRSVRRSPTCATSRHQLTDHGPAPPPGWSSSSDCGATVGGAPIIHGRPRFAAGRRPRRAPSGTGCSRLRSTAAPYLTIDAVGIPGRSRQVVGIPPREGALCCAALREGPRCGRRTRCRDSMRIVELG